jgi:hypothetical protein
MDHQPIIRSPRRCFRPPHSVAKNRGAPLAYPLRGQSTVSRLFYNSTVSPAHTLVVVVGRQESKYAKKRSITMSLLRTVRNMRAVGFKEWFRYAYLSRIPQTTQNLNLIMTPSSLPPILSVTPSFVLFVSFFRQMT